MRFLGNLTQKKEKKTAIAVNVLPTQSQAMAGLKILPAEVSERLIGICHFMDVLATLDGTAALVRCVQ